MTTPSTTARSDPPLFSIIVATLNASTLLGRTLDSVLLQNCFDWELWVIDGASRDGTPELAARRGEPRIKVISEPDDGIGDAWNKGVQRSTGRWLVFLGAGDTLPFNTLSRMARAAPGDNDTACILFGDTALESPEGQVDLVYGKQIGAGGPRLGFPFLHPSCATSRTVFERIGLFDTRLRIAVDGDFLLRAWCQKVPFVRGDQTVVMLAGGVSDRRWLAANLEYADCVARHQALSPNQHRRLRWGVHLRNFIFKRLGVSQPLRALRQLLIFAAIGGINLTLAWIPTFTLRRWVLAMTGCRIHPSAAIHRKVRLFSLGRLTVGANSTVNRGVYLDNRNPITIGCNVSIAHDARIYTMGHDIDDPYFKLRGAEVTIDDRACLFAAAIVLPGVHVGAGAVVLPGTVVQRDLPAHAVLRPVNDTQLGRRATDLQYEIKHQVWLAS